MSTFDKRKGFVAVLDTMWGDGGDAPSWFLINPLNHSGRDIVIGNPADGSLVATIDAPKGGT